MADLPHFCKLLHFPSHSLNSPLSLPLNLSPLPRKLSLSSLLPKLSSPSNSPNFLLISTSVQSDGSFVFKFGDASEIPPTVESVDVCDTVSDNAVIEPELGIQNVEDDTEAKNSADDEQNLDVIAEIVENDSVVSTAADFNSTAEVVENVDVRDTVSDYAIIEPELGIQNVENDVEDDTEAKDSAEDEQNIDVVADIVENDSVVSTAADFNSTAEDVENVDVRDTVSDYAIIEPELGIQNVENDVEDDTEAKDSAEDEQNLDVVAEVVENDSVVSTEADFNSTAEDVENVDVRDTVSDYAIIEPELGIQNVENDVEDDTEAKDSAEDEQNLDVVAEIVENDSVVSTATDFNSIAEEVENVDVRDTVSDYAIIEPELGIQNVENDVEDDTKAKDSPESEESGNESAADSFEEVEDDSAAAEIVENDSAVVTAADNSIAEDCGVVSESGFDVKCSDTVVELESNEIEEEDEVVELTELPVVQLEAEPVLDEEVDDAASPAIVESDIYLCADNNLETIDPQQSQKTATEASLDSENDVEFPTSGLSKSQEAFSSPLPLEVNDAGLPSNARLEVSPTDDSAREAFASLEASVITSTGTTADREEIDSHSGDISTMSLSISSVAASLSHPLNVIDAVRSATLHSDDYTESTDISEPADPGLELSGTASTETSLDSEQNSKVAVSVPSAATSLPHAIEVNDAAIPCIQQTDDDIRNDISVAADPRPGIFATAETSLREEVSVPSLSLVSAAASLAHLAEAVAGGDDAYFVCDNWFGVADGVGQWSFGGIDKGLYAQEFIQNCEKLARQSQNTGLSSLKELLQKSAEMTQSTGAARVLIAHIADKVLHVANIGDSGFVIIRNGTVFKKSSPMFHEFNFPYAISSGDNPVEAIEEYHIELDDGDIIVTATDGLFDNIYEHEITSLICKAVEDGKNLKDMAELLASRAQEVGTSPNARTPFSDAAQAAGHTEFSGGKYDHVTVIVSAVQKE